MTTTLPILLLIAGVAAIVIAIVLLVINRQPPEPPPPPEGEWSVPFIEPADGTFPKGTVVEFTMETEEEGGKLEYQVDDEQPIKPNEQRVTDSDTVPFSVAVRTYGEGKESSDWVGREYKEEEDPGGQLPEGKYNLANEVVKWMGDVPQAEYHKSPNMAASYKQASEEAAQPGAVLGQVRERLRLRNFSIVGEEDIPKWEPFSARYTLYMNILESEGKINSMADYSQAFLEVSWGLEATHLF